MAREAWNYKKPINVKREMLGAEGKGNYNSLKYSMIGFAIFFSTYTAVFSIGTILNDRQYNTWQRMLMSPVSKISLLGGSMIAAYIIGIFQLGIIIIGVRYIFQVDWGSSIIGIITITAAFIFTITCLGLFLSGIVKTHAQLAAITPVVLTSTAMLGGCMWPLEIVNSKVLLALANLTPHKWAIEGMEKIASYGYGMTAGVKLVRFE